MIYYLNVKKSLTNHQKTYFSYQKKGLVFTKKNHNLFITRIKKVMKLYRKNRLKSFLLWIIFYGIFRIPGEMFRIPVEMN